MFTRITIPFQEPTQGYHLLQNPPQLVLDSAKPKVHATCVSVVYAALRTTGLVTKG
jgi:hypothetical protein